MKRFMYLVVLAASFVLAAGAVAAQGSTRPDDRAIHGPGAVGLDVGQTAVVRPDDRASHGPGAFAAADLIRPDDRAWRGVGPVPTIEPIESPSVRVDQFDWADAGIGAGAALGLGLLLLGCSTLLVRRSRVAALS